MEVSEDSMGQYTVDFKDYGWFPDVLPSEAGLVESSDEEDEEAEAEDEEKQGKEGKEGKELADVEMIGTLVGHTNR